MPVSISGAPLLGPTEMERGPSVVVAVLVWACAAIPPAKLHKSMAMNAKRSIRNPARLEGFSLPQKVSGAENCWLGSISLFFQHLCERLAK